MEQGSDMGETLNAIAAISVTLGVIMGSIAYGWRTVSRKMNGGDPVVAKLDEVVKAIEVQNDLAGTRHTETIRAHGKTATAIAGLRGFVEGSQR